VTPERSSANRPRHVPDALLPVLMAGQVLRHRAHRAAAARRQQDRGALSIELALLVIVLILAAGIVVAAITNLVQSKAAQIK
jgi:hypothetical protein